MKLQIKIQKILFLVTLIIAALTLVYGFSYCTGALTYAFKAISGGSGDLKNDPIGVDALYKFVMGKGDFTGSRWEEGPMGFNSLIVVLGIVLVVLAALQFFFATNSRRNYYITNYISIGVLVVFAIVVAAVGFWGVAKCESMFNDLDWVRYKEVYDRVQAGTGSGWEYYSESHSMFILGYVLYTVVLIDAILLVLNAVWKYLLMKGEKELLSKNPNLTEEVA